MRIPNNLNFLVIFSYFFIYIIWGGNFLAIRYAIQEISPFLMIGSRFVISGVILFIVGFAISKRLPQMPLVKQAILQGFFLNLIGTSALVYGEQYVPSGLASILLSTIPLWVVIIDRENWKENFNNKAIVSGVMLGIIGVVIVALDQEVLPVGISKELFLYGIFIILGGAFFWAVGSVFINKNKVEKDMLLINVAIQLLFAGLIQIIISLVLTEDFPSDILRLNKTTYYSMGYLIILSSLIGYVAYVWLLGKRSATEVGTHTFINPVVAVIAGILLYGEAFTLDLFLGLIFVLTGVFLIKYKSSNGL